MSLTNWVGQPVEVGTIVGRGARDGNTSSFKVGVVTKAQANERPTVHWMYEEGWNGRREISSNGSPSASSLFVIDVPSIDPEVRSKLTEYSSSLP